MGNHIGNRTAVAKPSNDGKAVADPESLAVSFTIETSLVGTAWRAYWT